MISLLVTLLIVLLIVGIAYWGATELGAPHPIPKLILVIGVVIVLIILITGIADVGDGRSDVALLL